MAPRHRLTIRPIDPDPRATAIVEGARQHGIDGVETVSVADIVFIDGDLDTSQLDRIHAVLVDPLLQRGNWNVPSAAGVEIMLQPGVTDTAADAVRHAADQLDIHIDAAATGTRVEFDENVSAVVANEVIAKLVANPIIERWSSEPIEPIHPSGMEGASPAQTIAIRDATDSELQRINTERALSLDPAEMVVIRDYFRGVDRDPTDVELETLGQTWSEHCSHKTFRAVIDATVTGDPDHGVVDDVTVLEPLMSQLRNCTESIDAPFVRSAFVGNAGIVEFDKGTTIAIKAETHNHPSAVEPFGGANTGVGGVIRDVLGSAHRPIAVTDVLCFGPPTLSFADLPKGALHPSRIRDGVIDGVADYGNKIGLPTVAGAVLYDRAYTTNPLVFAGCIGTAPARPLHEGPHAGDRIVVVGGATGRDGIRGATFSSATMDATTGEVAGASVQIGDPIVEKLLIDALIGAEDDYSAITDCGAGGLSSAIGEMADGVGADVDLDKVTRKYPGLEPWEVWLSEAQERMVIAVPPRNLLTIEKRCERVGLGMADIGAFTGDKILTVRSGGEVVLQLDTAFLHDGRPQRRMAAVMPQPNRSEFSGRKVPDAGVALLALLAHPNIASKATTIHRYDHEILGSTVIRPLIGAASDGPADGVVLAPPGAPTGLAIGIGVNPWIGLHDPEAMAYAVVDEAIRNVVAVGADPDRVALLDNFSWGDPRRPSTLGELAAAVEGCVAAALMNRAPFVSGKDSLNNEYMGADGHRHAVPPTLVITAVAHVPDANRCVTPDLAEAGNLLMLLGSTETEFAGSHFDLVFGEPANPGIAPSPDPDAPERYRQVHSAMQAGLIQSCHDVSEGGFAVAIAEMCIAGRLGATITSVPHDDFATALFSESIGRLIVEIEPRSLPAFRKIMNDDCQRIGEVNNSGVLALPGVAPIQVADLADAFNRVDDFDPAARFAASAGNERAGE